MPVDITDYIFVTDDDEVLEERGYRDDEPAVKYCEELARKHNKVVGVYRVVDICDPKDL